MQKTGPPPFSSSVQSSAQTHEGGREVRCRRRPAVIEKGKQSFICCLWWYNIV